MGGRLGHGACTKDVLHGELGSTAPSLAPRGWLWLPLCTHRAQGSQLYFLEYDRMTPERSVRLLDSTRVSREQGFSVLFPGFYSAQLSPGLGSQGTQGTQFNGSSKIVPYIASSSSPLFPEPGHLGVLVAVGSWPVHLSPFMGPLRPLPAHNVSFTWPSPTRLSPPLQIALDFFRDRFKPLALAPPPETPSSALQSSGHTTCPWTLLALGDLGNLFHSCHSLWR